MSDSPQPLVLAQSAPPSDEILDGFALNNGTVHRLLEAGERAYRAARRRPNGTMIKRYIDRQDAIVTGLREELRAHGFTREVFKNAEITTSLSTRRKIIVASGDEHTGVDGAIAKFRSRRKRRVLAQLLKESKATVDMFDKRPAWEIWVLLVHFDPKTAEIRAQLSQVMSMTGDGKDAVWGRTSRVPPLMLFKKPVTPVVKPKKSDKPKRPKKTVEIKRK